MVVGWDEVSMDEGTGIVHIAPGCGADDYELGQREGLAAIVPVDESGAFYDGFGWLHGRHTADAAQQIVEDLGQRGRLVEAGEITHRYPVCWRCGTELIYRLVDEWFIRCDEVREPMIEAARSVEWTPEQYGKRMEDWLRNMGDWCISRKRYWGLPLPFYFCPDGHMTVISSRQELDERATTSTDGLEELHRPWIDDIRIRCGECDAEAERLPDVGDCWLDAGIVPFSTLGWNSPEFGERGYGTGAAAGVTVADLPAHADWELWFPADWVSEMREQIRLWFYSMLFMSVVLVGETPYRRVLCYEKVNDETGRPMHKSWGNAIWFDDAVERMGADVMRWMFAAQTPSQNMNFGYGPANEVKRRLLTLWNTYNFFVLYAIPDGYEPRLRDARDAGPTPPSRGRSTAGWRRVTQQLVGRLPGRARRLRLAAAGARGGGVRGRPLQLVRAPVQTTVLEVGGRRRQAGRLRHAVVRAGAADPLRCAGDAVPGRRAVAEPGARRLPGRARTACICRLSRSPIRRWPTRSWSAEMAERAGGGAARPRGPLGRQREAAPATVRGDRRHRRSRPPRARRPSRRPDRRRAGRQVGAAGHLGRGVRRGRGDAAAEAARAQVRPRPGHDPRAAA